MKGNKGAPLLIISAVVAAVHAISGSGSSKAVQGIRGENTTLPCTFKIASTETINYISWKGRSLGNNIIGEFARKLSNGSELYRAPYQGRVRFSNNFKNGDARITLDNVTMQDNGTYECLIEIKNVFPSRSVDVELLVLVRPSSPVCNIIGNPEYGQNINLTCNSVEGSPKPEYTWQSYDVQNQTRPLQGIALGGVLMLNNVSINTTGYYICVSQNIVGENKCNIMVAIRPPSMNINIALYAGIIGGILAAIIIISVLVYCCCCRKSKNPEYEATETENTFQPKHENVVIRGPSKEEIRDEEEERLQI